MHKESDINSNKIRNKNSIKISKSREKSYTKDTILRYEYKFSYFPLLKKKSSKKKCWSKILTKWKAIFHNTWPAHHSVRLNNAQESPAAHLYETWRLRVWRYTATYKGTSRKIGFNVQNYRRMDTKLFLKITFTSLFVWKVVWISNF